MDNGCKSLAVRFSNVPPSSNALTNPTKSIFTLFASTTYHSYIVIVTQMKAEIKVWQSVM